MQIILNKRLFKRIAVGTIILGIAIPTGFVLIKNTISYTTHQIGEFFTPSRVTFEICNIENAMLRQTIINFVEEHTNAQSLLNFKADNFFAELQQEFAIVKKVEWQLRPPKTLHLIIVGHTPTARVNDDLVLGQENQLLDNSFFQDTTLEKLPHITIASRWIKGQRLANQAAAFVHAIKPEQWASYAITYHAPWNIHAVPYQSVCKCRIITDEKSFFEEHKFGAISSIFTSLCNDGLITKKMLQAKGTPLAFDLRIKNQVIVQLYEPIKRGKGL